MKISATEFQQNVGRYQDAALRRPVTITKNGRDHTVLIAAELFETLLKGRVAQRVVDLDRETIDAIARSEVPAKFAHLDKLMRKSRKR